MVAMSGSFNRPPPGSRPGGPHRLPQRIEWDPVDEREFTTRDPYSDPRTGRPGGPYGEPAQPYPASPMSQGAPQGMRGDPYAAPQGYAPDGYVEDNDPAPTMPARPLRLDPRQGELSAPARSSRSDEGASTTPIVPAGSVTGRSLTLVVAIMCFLACLTAGAVYMMNQSASAWLRDIASEVTVQVESRQQADMEKVIRDVAQFLGQQQGVRSVRPLAVEDSAKLLEPWLGQADVLRSLPVPRLVALEIDRNAPPNMTQLRTALTAQFKGVALDDHRQWQQQIRTVTRSFALGGIAILILVGAATTAIIISATRSALASNRDIVEVLHFVGATDAFIAREFEKHFLRLGIKAGVVGAAAAMIVFLGLSTVMELLGGGTVTAAELKRLVGSGVLDLPGYVLLGIVVVVIAALCMLTSRIGVYRILNSHP
jgi:cell division transport system permease protein